MTAEITVKDALDVLQKAMQSDPEYAWSWHCNIAMAQYDAMIIGRLLDRELIHNRANKGAAVFMKNLFGVEGYEPKTKSAANS